MHLDDPVPKLLFDQYEQAFSFLSQLPKINSILANLATFSFKAEKLNCYCYPVIEQEKGKEIIDILWKNHLSSSIPKTKRNFSAP